MANEATKLTIGGVQHDIKDAEARRLIALLQAALDAMTGTDTTTAIETFQEVLDFLAGVTDDETLVGKITALQTAINGKVDKETGKGLSTNDYTTAEKQKLAGLSNYNDSALQTAVNNLQTALANVYTKAQTDSAIQEAVDGLGSGSVESVTVNGVNHTPDSNGIVDLGTIQGAKGDKGDKGDTVVIDPEGLAQFEIANDLDTSDPTQGLSARQGKILKQAINTVQTNLQAVVDALANMAFTSAKPNLSQIDWTGGTFYATVVKNLSGCTATDNTTNGQIAEGQTLTMQLTADSGFTLTGATISVTNSKGQSVAYTLNGSTLTVANVTGTITVSVVAVGVFSVVNNDTNVNLTASTTSPTSGSSWTGTLAVKSGISNYRLASAPVVTMGGTAVDFTASGNSWNSSTGVMTIGNVTGNIVITSASVEMVAHRVANHFINMESSGANLVEDGDDYTAVLSPTTGATSNGDLRVFVDGEPLESTDYTLDSASGALTIPAAKITGDVDILASASSGVVVVKAKTSGTTATINGTTTITCNEADGDLFKASASGITEVSNIVFSNKTDIAMVDFGGTKVTNLRLSNSKPFSIFSDATSLAVVANLVIPNSVTSLKFLFRGCTALSSIDMSHIDTSNVTSIASLFLSCSAMTSIAGLQFLDTRKVLEANSIFQGASSLTQLEIPFDLTAATAISWMCCDMKNLQRVVYSGKGGSHATSMENMFGSTNVSYADISALSLTGITSISGAFNIMNQSNITVKVGEFDLSGVTSSSNPGMWRIKTLICTTATPPDAALFSYMNSLTAIYVPNNAVDAYKTAWASKASNIHPVSEYTE